MSNKNKAYIYLILTVSAWGSLYVASKFVLNSIPPITVLFLRYLISSLILLGITKMRPKVVIEKSDYKYIIFMGVVGYFMAISAQMIGTKLANASIASLINSMNPVFVIIFAVPALKEKITYSKVIAIVASVIGAYVIIGHSNASGETLGIIFSIFSVAMWSLMTVLARKVTQKYDAITITTYAIIIAAICTFPTSIIEVVNVSHGEIFSMSNMVWILYIGIFCTAIPHLLWNKSLSLIEAGECSLFYPVQPIVSAILGSIFLGEHIGKSFILGAALIIGGILFSILNGYNKKLAVNEEPT
jgi:drug/metabolite transporter (DMT)-like permease